MTPLHRDQWLDLYLGDAAEVLRSLAPESVHMVVTSPPYWNLRDYGVDGQLGLEATPELYVERLVAIFREVGRVLRRDGTVWLNLGDSYSGGGRGRGEVGQPSNRGNVAAQGLSRDVPLGLKAKDLVGIPWMVAFALRADGWYLRRDVIWSKPNPMPESAADRPVTSHEYLFLLSRSERYFYDGEPIREPNSAGSIDRFARDPRVTVGSKYAAPAELEGRPQFAVQVFAGRSKRSVWTIATEPYAGAHFATFPTRLVEPCILAGTSARGVCPSCGAPWIREVDVEYLEHERGQFGRKDAAWDDGGRGGLPRADRRSSTSVSRTGCGCGVSMALEPDDLELIESPAVRIREGAEADPAAGRTTGTRRRGMDRARNAGEGHVSMTRYEQRAYARQIDGLAAELRAVVAAEAGTAISHYRRTDRAGARAIPLELLEGWIGRGILERVTVPVVEPHLPTPATVLDPFAGSGTVGLVAERLGRRSVLIELKADYAAQALERIAEGRRDGSGPAVDLPLEAPEGSLWEGVS